MTSYEGNMSGAGNVNKAGHTQPLPGGSQMKNPGGSGAVPAVQGKTTPVIVKTGAVNNGR